MCVRSTLFVMHDLWFVFYRSGSEIGNKNRPGFPRGAMTGGTDGAALTEKARYEMMVLYVDHLYVMCRLYLLS